MRKISFVLASLLLIPVTQTLTGIADLDVLTADLAGKEAAFSKQATQLKVPQETLDELDKQLELRAKAAPLEVPQETLDELDKQLELRARQEEVMNAFKQRSALEKEWAPLKTKNNALVQQLNSTTDAITRLTNELKDKSITSKQQASFEKQLKTLEKQQLKIRNDYAQFKSKEWDPINAKIEAANKTYAAAQEKALAGRGKTLTLSQPPIESALNEVKSAEPEASGILDEFNTASKQGAGQKVTPTKPVLGIHPPT